MRIAWAGAVVVAVVAAAVVSQRPEHPAWRAATPPGGALVGFAVAGREVVTVDPARPGGPAPLLRRCDAARGTLLGATPLAVPPGCDRLAVVAAADGERAVIGAARAQARVYDLHTGRSLGWPVRPHPAGPVALSADGRWLAFGDGDPAAATPSHVAVIDLTLDREPFTVPLPPGATADVWFGPRLSVLVKPGGGVPRWVEHVALDDDRPPITVRPPAGRDWVRLGPPADRVSGPVLLATVGAAFHAYTVGDGWAERFPDGDPSDRDVTLQGYGWSPAWTVRLRSWRDRGARVERFEGGVAGERTGLPADSLPHPDGQQVVSLADDGTLTLRPIVPPSRSWWPAVVAGAVPLGLAATVAAWRAARRLRAARRWAAAAVVAAAGMAGTLHHTARPRWQVPVGTPGGVAAFDGAAAAGHAAGFTFDGREVVAVEHAQALGDRHAVSLLRLDAATGDLRGRVRLTAAYVRSLAAVVSPDGARAVVGDLGPHGNRDEARYAMYDADTGRRVRAFPAGVRLGRRPFSPCGRWLLVDLPTTADDGATTAVVAAADGTTAVTLPAASGAGASCFAPDGIAVAVSRFDGTLTVVDIVAVPSGRPVRRFALPLPIFMTDWQAGRLFIDGDGSFDPWGDPVASRRAEPVRESAFEPERFGPPCGPGWFTRFAPVDEWPPLVTRLAGVCGVSLTGARWGFQSWEAVAVYDAATNRQRCWSPRPLPGPVALSRDGRLAAGVDEGTGELQLVALVDGSRWLVVLLAGAVPFGVAWAVGRRGR